VRMACALMSRFGVSHALIGDLLETRRDHSRLWFWRQALVAIVRTSARDVAGHKLLVARAIAIAWALNAVTGRLVRPVMLATSPWTWNVDLWIARHVAELTPISTVLFETLAAVVTGWIIARLHRPLGLAAVWAYAVSLVVYDCAGFVNSFERGLFRFGGAGLAMNALLPLVILPIAALSGALLAADAGRSARFTDA
jgi:hypothetical protein